MSLEVEATYENGVLKLDKPLPLDERERITVSIKPQASRIRRSAACSAGPERQRRWITYLVRTTSRGRNHDVC